MERERRSRRKRTGRKYIMAPPPPVSPIPITILILVGILAGFQAVLSREPVLWGVLSGGCLFVAGYLIAKSFMPVKRYRDTEEVPATPPPPQ